MVGNFSTTICVKLKCGKVAVLVPVDKNTRMTEVKASFLEAIAPLSPEDAASSGIPDPGTLGSSGDSIRLFKDSTDDSGEPIWLPLADSATVDKAGLDQGHTVGVSFKTPEQDDFEEPMIASPDEDLIPEPSEDM